MFPSVVVFDVDDTLYLERDYVRSGFDAVERESRTRFGVVGVGDEAWRLFEEGVRGTTLSQALRAVTGDERLLEACIEIYRCHRPRITLLPDALRLLRLLAGTVPIAVVTDGPARSQRAKCRALGLEPFVGRFVVTDELGTSKPDPVVFDRAVSGWAERGNPPVYVGDNPFKDFVSPVAMGWSVVRVKRPLSLHFAVPTPQGVREVEDLEQLSIDFAELRR